MLDDAALVAAIERASTDLAPIDGMVTPCAKLGDRDGERETMKLAPVQRRGDGHDIVGTLTFFLPDLSKYVTGQTLAVHRGYTAVGPIDYSGYGVVKGVTGGDTGDRRDCASQRGCRAIFAEYRLSRNLARSYAAS